MSRLSWIDLENCFSTSSCKQKYNKELFTLIAPKYNFATRMLSFGCDKYWKKKLINNLPLIKKPTCLDLACGTGDITFQIARRYSKGKIYGLDITKAMIEEAQKINQFKNIEFIHKDMCNTDFDNNRFDIITASYALRNASNLYKTITEIKRILKPNGTLAILEFAKFDNKVLQKIQYYLLKYWGYFWGIILHRNYTTYGYIAESLKHYPTKNEFENLIKSHNFEITKKENLFFGTIQIIMAKKN